ncbi:MAG: O-antigen polysaccharide polymerase Wzy family protein [Lachnospiraceae bacterium]|nr:O-antigen polysaccharide polymerase Wzy family protein [Lachnospiraceae bacterium]
MVLYLFGISSFNIIFFYSTFLYVVIITTWLINCDDKLNYFTIILILSYVYYFGQYLINYFGFDFASQYTIKNTYSNTEINQTALYILLNIVTLHIGVLVFNGREPSTKKRSSLNRRDAGAFSMVVAVLLPISFVCEVLILVFKIRLNVVYGYSIALNTTYNGAGSLSYIVNFISTLFLPSVFAGLIVSKGKKVNFLVWLIFLIYMILYFMSGSRYEVATALAGILLLYHFYYKKIKWKSMLLLAGCGLLFLFVFSVMSNMRRISNYGNTSDIMVILKTALSNVGESNFLTEVISVAGFQILACTAIFKYCPSTQPFTYGMYYLGGIVRVIPNLFGGNNIFITDSIDTIFRQYLTKTYGMGSSFIMEAYYNFGWCGILVMLFYAYLIVFLCRSMQEIRNGTNQDQILMYFVFYIAATSMFWIRSDARFLLREIVYYYFGIKVLVSIVKGTFLRH